ncbi:MAG: cobyrinate a,c-diamide synthase, partial [Nitrospirae bacterium]|nr:cobyrinate a,c-diamide synthase [Candidatus Manganitrophaceae bacterium]
GGKGSTAEIARLLDLPVILVVDAKGMAQSAGALVAGYANYHRKTRIAGVIFNRVASEGHYDYLKKAVKIPSLGWIAKNKAMQLPERHLGLVPANERKPDIEQIRQNVVAHLDLEKLLSLSKIPRPKASPLPMQKKRVRIAYALDQAFHFYYQDNLDLLAAAGAELLPFSPLSDQCAPDADLLYLGGGFPECFEKELLENKTFCEAIRVCQLPIYAECGGLYYLSLIGKIPGKMQMRDRLQHFGYTEATAQVDSCLLQKGEKIKGHMFHYSHWEGVPNLYVFEKRGLSISEGYADAKIHASFLHVHFLSKPVLACRLVDAAQRRKGGIP